MFTIFTWTINGAGALEAEIFQQFYAIQSSLQNL